MTKGSFVPSLENTFKEHIDPSHAVRIIALGLHKGYLKEFSLRLVAAVGSTFRTTLRNPQGQHGHQGERQGAGQVFSNPRECQEEAGDGDVGRGPGQETGQEEAQGHSFRGGE